MSKESLLQTFLFDLFVKGIYYVVRFYINVTDCVGITCYWSKTIFIIYLMKKIFFGKLFEKSFCSNTLASFTKFECQGTDTFGFIWVQTIQIHI